MAMPMTRLHKGGHHGGDVRKDHIVGVHALPVRSTVFRAVDGTGLITGVENVGILGMKGQRPDILASARGFQRLPVFALVIAAVHACLSTGVKNVGIARVHG